MESAGNQRKQARGEPVVEIDRQRRANAHTVSRWPLSFNDAHSPALRLGHGPEPSRVSLPHSLQAKLTVGEPGDQYEQEADGVAEQVMRMHDPDGSTQARGESEAHDDYHKQRMLQRRARAEDGGASLGVAPAIVEEELRSPGQRLDTATLTFMESRFNKDFSQVRVHTDASAGQSSSSINALAYTVGHDVVFAPGRFAPQTLPGKKLLAHELTHVLQQRASATTPGRLADRYPETQEPRVGTGAGGSLQASDHLKISTPPNGLHVQRGFGELRVAEARMLEEELAAVDGEFWMLPPRLPRDVYPIFDDEETGVVVGFRSRGSVVSTYDLEGNLVGMDEPGLETPLLDPIDFLAGGIVGLGRSILGGGVRSAARGAATGAGRSGIRALATGVGLRVAARNVARELLIAIRGAYRAIRFRGVLNFTATTLARMADPARRVPQHILKLAIRFGTRAADPQGVAGAFRYVMPMIRNGTEYTLEVVIREADQTVLHFLYR